MTKDQAEQIAEILDGEATLGEDLVDGEENWLVFFERADGRLVVLSGRSVDEYADREAFKNAYCYATIGFREDSA